MIKPQVNCRHFNGYKPCGKSNVCESTCPHLQIRGPQILIIHLGALGAVVRSTALLAPLLRKFPKAEITWITDAPAHHLLLNHPEISRVLSTSESGLLELSTLDFEAAFILDKSLKATGVFKRTRARKVYGFISDSFGVVHPATPAADELWTLGLDNEKKFYRNQKTELQLMCEALELVYQKDEYHLPLTFAEKEIQFSRWSQWSENGKKTVIGINTGCANTIAAKKLSVENHRELIRRLESRSDIQVVLLGGPEDTNRNAEIAQGNRCLQTPTQLGLRDGLISVAACDVIITGDSLGLHMAISQKRWVVAWFGPTCAQEIELFDRGEKILSQAACSPCWKRSCHKPVMCYDLVELDDIIKAVHRRLSPSQFHDQVQNQLGGANSLSW